VYGIEPPTVREKKIEEDEMGRTCGTYVKQEKYIQILVRKIEGKKRLEILRHRWQCVIKTGVK
jgi:hypothetical protein